MSSNREAETSLEDALEGIDEWLSDNNADALLSNLQAGASEESAKDASLEKALDDIKEWLTDNHAEALVANLQAGASEELLKKVEAALCLPLPTELRALYECHNGQQRRDQSPFFEHLAFLDVESALALREAMLTAHFGRGAQGIDATKISCDRDTPLLEEELSDRWFPFANTASDYLAINLDTGRVYFAVKDVPALTLAGESFGEFLTDYADALWNDEYALAGDPSLEGVTVEGEPSLGRYTTKDF